MAILTVNAGSSSLKFSLFPLHHAEVQAEILNGNIEGLEPGGAPEMRWTYQGQKQSKSLNLGSEGVFAKALMSLHELLGTLPGVPAIAAVAHRVVHGGKNFRDSVMVTDEVLAQLTELNSLAPLHQPANMAGIRAFREAFAGVAQIACFDTAYHATLPEVDFRFGLPEALYQQGLRRYGFHGLSYQYVIGALLQHTERAKGRVLMAHLGNGGSLCAAREGKSVSTTMGFSPLDGVMMGTRTGNLDPGVLLYLMEQGWNHDQMEKLLYKQSGLLGVSGVSADMRRLRSEAAGNASVQLALDMFTYRVVRESGAMVACLQGLDVLAFSGGIGEHDVELRTEMGKRLAWMGVVIDPERNARAVGSEIMSIHAPTSAVEVWVVPTDEGIVVAREAARLISN